MKVSFNSPFNLLLDLVLLALLVDNNYAEFTQHRREVMDVENGSYILEWWIDYDVKVIRFNATASTNGWIGFGLSKSGGMVGSDIVIGGVYGNGSTYFTDRHAIGEFEPILDTVQNWELISAHENNEEGTTNLIFSRSFNTCDEEDVILSNDTTNFIWAYSSSGSDEIAYHTPTKRGTLTVQPLDPEVPAFIPDNYQQYTITHNMTMPKNDTTYWCTIHKSPVFMNKHHIVAFEPLLNSPEAKAHTHHYNIFRCSAPEGMNASTFFDPYVGRDGGECYVPEPNIPSQFCQTMFYNWAVGGRMLVLPDNIGYPIGETGSSVDYYMFEIHYNNPQEFEGVTFETGAIIYYTDNLREHDAGLMVVAHHTSISLTVPPNSTEWKTAGHCDEACTREYLPKEGINVFAIFLHAHLSGRKMKFRQFRDGVELPWAANDETYDFEFQQTRALSKELKIERGDHLTMECTYDTTWYDQSSVVIGGLSTTNEMCQSIFWYYPRAELRDCRSEYPIEDLFAKFGIESANRSTPYEDAIITSPSSLEGMKYTQVLNTLVTWNSELRQEIQQDILKEKHIGVCWTAKETVNIEATGYPSLREKEYQPIDQCVNSSLGDRLTTSWTLLLLSIILYYNFGY